MFNHLFFTHAPSFRAQVENANAHRLDPELRHVAFTLFVHDALGWFRDNSALQAVKLTCVALPEIESNPKAVRIRHHLKLSSTGYTVADDNYALVALPWAMMGDGTFELTRQDPAVQAFLSLTEDDADASEGHLSYAGAVHALAVRVDAAFEHFAVNHDFGLASSTR